MAKRRAPQFQGLLARPIDPWRDRTDAALSLRRWRLFEVLDIEQGRTSADWDAFGKLARRHGLSEGAAVRTSSGGPVALAALAAGQMTGFQSSVRGRKYADVLRARYPRTRPSELPWKDIRALVLAVDAFAVRSASGRRVGIKVAINRLTETGQPFEHLRHRRRELEAIYYRHRARVEPRLPSLLSCAKPNGVSCFSDDVVLEEVSGSCRLRNSTCPFWVEWDLFLTHFLVEYDRELKALAGWKRHMRIISHRPVRRHSSV